MPVLAASDGRLVLLPVIAITATASRSSRCRCQQTVHRKLEVFE